MKTEAPIAIHWFKHDLRLDDNAALRNVAGKASELLCVYVVDPRWFKPSHFQSSHMGKARWQFLLESLQDLDAQLNELGQSLHVVFGEPLTQLKRLIGETRATVVSSTSHCGVYERQQWQRLQQTQPHLRFIDGNSHTLFAPEQLPFAVDDLPKTFTPFRKQADKLSIDPPLQAPHYLPTKVSGFSTQWSNELPAITATSNLLSGGAGAANRQLNYYLFETDLIKNYKQTRNGLDGWDFSSKLSAWLANGCLSAKSVVSAIKRYEAQRGANESTYWLVFELLWREFFYWYAVKHQHSLFRFAGVVQKKPLTSFWPQRFAKWCAGNTPYPIVNACMKQLNATGFMSNRGRQLVASCLVHELGLDWRYGAAYFEQQLIDFDVASNYGNWQYLAGTGADPRGHRKFDLQKQTQIYDPQGVFISAWQGQGVDAPLDDVDPSDWPISWQ